MSDAYLFDKLGRRDWFIRIATDKDLGRPDRRLRLTVPAGICRGWLSERRIIPHEWITDDGVCYECSQCGEKIWPEAEGD